MSCNSAVKRMKTRVGRVEEQGQNMKTVNLIHFLGFVLP